MSTPDDTKLRNCAGRAGPPSRPTGRTATEVLAGKGRWAVACSDALAFLNALPDDSIDLLITSPPYERQRTYGIGDQMRGGEDWVEWMFAVVSAAAPKVKGLIAVNCEGRTRDFNYSAVPFLLLADLKRAGFTVRKPCVFHRVGIPGSGGPDWFRNDWEPVICVTRPGKLPWSDNTACGHPPKWAPGGEMSHRLTDGKRVNQWGHGGDGPATTNRDKNGKRNKRSKPSHIVARVGPGPGATPSLFEAGASVGLSPTKNAFGVNRNGIRVGARRGTDDHKASAETPAHAKRKVMTLKRDGMHNQDQDYQEPVLANPGNLVQQTYTADEVAELLARANDVLHTTVGGGQMGHALASENEAPFPVELVERFVLSFCPPDGVVCDPFSGGGTVCHTAVEHGRRFVGCDLRANQARLCERRMLTVTPSLFVGG